MNEISKNESGEQYVQRVEKNRQMTPKGFPSPFKMMDGTVLEDTVTIATSDIDRLFHEAETKSDEWAAVEKQYLDQKTDFDAWASSTKDAYKNHGSSVAAAVIKLESHEQWARWSKNLNLLNVQEKEAKRNYTMAMVRMELWKTCQVNARGLTR